MPDAKKGLKPQYEGKGTSIITSQKSKTDEKSEFSSLSRIIEKSKKLEESFKYQA